jgi:hypothetical protein
VCWSLHHDYAVKQGQIAHLDHDPSNHDIENLAWLCIPHHDQYDTTTSQSKGFTISEVKQYRKALAEEVDRRRRLATAGKDVDKARLIQENLALFLFAAQAMYTPQFRALLRKEVTDPDFLAQVEQAWAFLDSPVPETERGKGPSRLDQMASYVGSCDEGRQDFQFLLALAGCELCSMNEIKRNEALFAIHNDIIRSGLMLVRKIHLDNVQKALDRRQQGATETNDGCANKSVDHYGSPAADGG